MADRIQSFSSHLPTVTDAKDAAPLQLLKELTTNAHKIQEEVLAEILSVNRDTEYLGRFDLRGATDRATFRTKLPLIDYDQVKPYVQRIADGDRSEILAAKPIIAFLASSGTSGGERKLMPETKDSADLRFVFDGLALSMLDSYIPNPNNRKRLGFFFASSERRTPAGHPVLQMTTSMFKSDLFSSRLQSSTSPIEAILCLDHFQSMYVQMLCGLYQNDEVRCLEAIFATNLLRAIHFLQTHYQELAHDISTGSLSPSITDASLRAAVSRTLLEPNPALGELVLRECSGGNWEGIVPRIWPKAEFLIAVMTGAFAKYIPDLEHFAGGLPIVSTMYASSECHIGMNLRPTCKPSDVWYTIMPNMAYFEFIPMEGGDGHGETADMSEVEVGKEYELVATTYTGLYRYCIGDVVRVMGFHNAAPQVHFVRRNNVLLSVENEKTDEVELQRGVDSASRLLLLEVETNIVEYTSYSDIKTFPGHYVVYLELLSRDNSRRPSGEVMERCCLAIEEELNARYRQGRVELGSIGALEIRVVREGTFDELIAHAVSLGSSFSQYKVPRCVKSPAVLELLDSRMTCSYFSTSLPSWHSPVNLGV